MSSGFGPGLILNLSFPGQLPGSGTIDSPLRARVRALHTREETTLKNRRFQPWANGRRQREDGRGLGVPGGGAALAKIIC